MPVNPKHRSVAGVLCYRDCESLPNTPDVLLESCNNVFITFTYVRRKSLRLQSWYLSECSHSS